MLIKGKIVERVNKIQLGPSFQPEERRQYEDDEFPNVTIMTTNVEEMHEEYRKIIQYLDGMRFPVGTTKAM